jgi:hypothetical protein
MKDEGENQKSEIRNGSVNPLAKVKARLRLRFKK